MISNDNPQANQGFFPKKLENSKRNKLFLGGSHSKKIYDCQEIQSEQKQVELRLLFDSKRCWRKSVLLYGILQRKIRQQQDLRSEIETIHLL